MTVRKSKRTQGKVVEAAMSAGSGGHVGAGPQLSGKDIEEAMGAATEKALAKGITDNDEILKLKLAAREQVKADHAKAVAQWLRDNSE